jgi:LacI family transcriptional regulator
MAKRHLIFALAADMGMGRGVIMGAASYLHGRDDWVTWAVESVDRRVIDNPGGPRPDAIIGRIPPELAAECRGRGGPVLVNVSRAHHIRPGVNVTCDDDAIARLAAEHLLGKGLEHFALYGNTAGWGRRGEAFVEAVARGSGAVRVLDAYAEPAELGPALEALPKPCGVLAFNDIHASALIRRCRQFGIDVPRDVAVIGVDNDVFVTVFSPVPVTSVDVDFEQVGHEAMRVLDEITNGAAPPKTPIRIPPTGVVERHSTDFPGLGDSLAVEAARAIRRRGCEPIVLPEMLAPLPASYKTVDRRFRKAFGRSLGEEVTRVRIAEAARLLRTTHLPPGVIAERVGYRNANYFSVAFRKHVGVPPGAYRKKHRAADSKTDPGGSLASS